MFGFFIGSVTWSFRSQLFNISILPLIFVKFQKPSKYLRSLGAWIRILSERKNSSNFLGVSGDGERDRMNTIAPHAPYIVSGIAKPTNSPAANWYNGLGNTSTNPGGFDLATEYANAKSAVAKTFNNTGPMAMLAVNDSPYYDWLKTKSLDKSLKNGSYISFMNTNMIQKGNNKDANVTGLFTRINNTENTHTYAGEIKMSQEFDGDKLIDEYKLSELSLHK